MNSGDGETQTLGAQHSPGRSQRRWDRVLSSLGQPLRSSYLIPPGLRFLICKMRTITVSTFCGFHEDEQGNTRRAPGAAPCASRSRGLRRRRVSVVTCRTHEIAPAALTPAASTPYVNLLFFLFSDHCAGQGIVQNRSVIRDSDALQGETSHTPRKDHAVSGARGASSSRPRWCGGVCGLTRCQGHLDFRRATRQSPLGPYTAQPHSEPADVLHSCLSSEEKAHSARQNAHLDG